MYEMRKKLSNTADKTPIQNAPKYLIRGDSNARLALWNLSSQSQFSNFIHSNDSVFSITKLNLILNYQADSLKYSDYETSLSKFWKENFKQDTENVIY